MKSTFAVRGNFIFTPTPSQFEYHENSWLICENGQVKGITPTLPEAYKNCPIKDWGNRLIIPGFVDLHLHGAQFLQSGMGMTKTLLDWLKDYTYDLERKFQDPDFATAAYEAFAHSLLKAGTLRSCIYASSSAQGTRILFEVLKKKGLGAYVGKVDMDCNAPDFIIESPEQSLAGTRALVEDYKNDPLVSPIITPRFAPTASRQLLAGLGQLAREFNLPVQSHIGENPAEVAWVKALFPEHSTYAQVYDAHGLFGTTPTAMAHAIFMEASELELAQKNKVFLVHCPDSNINVRSGIMPVAAYLEAGMKLGLGSDIAGGHKIAMNEAIVRAVQLSKLNSLDDTTAQPLSISQAFFLATKGGGEFFGKIGSLEPGFAFDALVIEDDPMIADLYGIEDRLEKFLYTGDDRNICARYIQGNFIQI